ncbi:MAG TPA: YggT family protein [Firmicutes bacterium]|nr:YggT family protein [Bacillota bacterium]
MSLVPWIIYYIIQAYILLILVWVFGSWFPQWRYQSWYRTVEDLVSPYMNLFKAIPLRIGMIDLAPMLAIFVLFIVQRLVISLTEGGAIR